jgi:hypothetical protein
VLERQGVFVYGGSIIGLIVLNFIFTFSLSGISVGGHVGGFVGGILAMLGFSRFGRTHALYGRAGLFGYGVLLAVGIASVVLAISTAPQTCNVIPLGF